MSSLTTLEHNSICSTQQQEQQEQQTNRKVDESLIKMLQRAILRIGAQTNKNLASVRWISKTTVLKGSQTTMADVVASTSENMNAHSISIDHLMTVERAAQLMAEHHVNALPIVENEKVWHFDVYL